MEDCIFCQITDKKIPAKILFENDQILAFHDINPVAPTHFLIIPKKHISSIEEIGEEDTACLFELMKRGSKLATELGLTDYRFVTNKGVKAGQSVFHLHFHVLGGRAMSWPPG